MILGEPYPDPSGLLTGGSLDAMLRRNAARHPTRLALADPHNRAAFTHGAPRTMTYAQADAMVSAIALRLRRLGLSADSVIGVQLPNTVENMLTLLGIMRAGMIVAPLPLLWRQADCIAALSRVGAKALVTCGRVGATDHGRLMMEVAAEIFPVRYVCGFGAETDDGIVPLDDLFDQVDAPDAAGAVTAGRGGDAADHVALVTFEVTPKGLAPVARSHRELMAAGVAVALAHPLPEGAAILCSVLPSSFCGVTAALMPWLLTGGTLVLHQPFEADAMAAQLAAHHCALAVLPGAVIPRLSEAGLLRQEHGLEGVLAVWRAPERAVTAPAWRKPGIALTDLLGFGETALFAMRRDADGRVAAIGLSATGPGAMAAPSGASEGLPAVETTVTPRGTLAVRGPMVPRAAFPPGAAPALEISPDGHVDTGYPCRLDSTTQTLILGGPPTGIVSVGGYRFVMREMQDLVARADPMVTLAALPDTLAGHRLAGNAGDRAGMREALLAYGANPLLVRAFRERHGPPPAT
jgi:acyl-coenzyme A synthetase/AMP-(fatty) acid ligase